MNPKRTLAQKSRIAKAILGMRPLENARAVLELRSKLAGGMAPTPDDHKLILDLLIRRLV